MSAFLRWIIRLAPLMMLLWVGVVALDLDGITRAVWMPGRQSPFIHGLRPTSRVQIDEDTGHITGDPVYMSVTPPGDYERATVKLFFRAVGNRMVELGATVNAAAGQIILKPIWHETLEHINWSTIREGDLVLYQREPVFDDVSDFLDAPPELSRIATYHAELPSAKRLPASWTEGTPASVTSASLRGFHEFVTVTDGSDVVLDVMYMDMNRNLGADPVTIRMYQDGRLLASAQAEDDGVEADTNASLGRQTLHVSAQKPSPGLIKVELNAGTDIYWRELHLSLPKLTFLSNVTIGDEVGYLPSSRPVSLVTDAQHLTVFTRHAEGVQTIKIGDRVQNIAVPHERYALESYGNGVTTVQIPKGDVVFVTDGLLAFSERAYFDPFPVRLDDRTDLDKLDVDFVLARYRSPDGENGWFTGSATFDVATLERERPLGAQDEPVGRASSLRFVISAPHIADRDASVEIERVEVVFERSARTIADVIDILKQKFIDSS